MYKESEESAAVQLKVSITKKDAKEEVEKQGDEDKEEEEEEEKKSEKNVQATKNEKESTSTESDGSRINGKEIVKSTETVNVNDRDEIQKEPKNVANIEKSTSDENSIVDHDVIVESFERLENDDGKVESSESQDAVSKPSDANHEPTKLHDSNTDNSILRNDTTNSEVLNKWGKNGHEIVESTTSETTEIVDVTELEKKEPETIDPSKDETLTTTTKTTSTTTTTMTTTTTTIIDDDPSLISYDSSIMLKNVQIKLNDCLKENSKLFDISNVDDKNIDDKTSNKNDEQKKHLDMSFGRTLRNISGRSTINRLRYVTVRENKISPNSSLFVNTSSASLDNDDLTSEKLIRYPTDLSDSIICNGSPAYRKRKIIENAMSSSKKLKTESGGLLNTSLEILKGLRRPVEASTPNTTTEAYKFQSEKFNREIFDDNTKIDDEPKKWCIVM